MNKIPPKKGVVAVDFDGVIGDSVKECFVQAVKAFGDMGGVVGRNSLNENKFREARPFVTKAKHFYTVLRLMQENPKIDFSGAVQKEIEAEYNKDTAKTAEFEERFYAHRKEMQENWSREWKKLQKSFPRVVDFIRSLQRKNDVFISTTKDKASVKELLRSYGIIIPGENIYARELSMDKKVHLREISKKTGVDLRKIVLVEDSLG